MKSLADNPERYLATAVQLLDEEGLPEAATVARNASVRVVESGYDNWNGGTTYWTIQLQLDPKTYARVGARREMLQEQISNRFKVVLEQFSTDSYTVAIVPRIDPNPEWRHVSGDVPREARQNIIDGLKLDGVIWFGRLADVEFLQRLFDLRALPSQDSRFEDAAGDIWQHRVNNDDWADDWIFEDSRFNLLNGPTDTFLRFLCEIVHPVVRPDRNETLMLVQHFNDQLRKHGWQLIEVERIAGRPRFVHKRLQAASVRSVSRARSVADALDAGWMQKEIERLESAIERDPALAIGTAKELVETCCKSILAKRGVEMPRSADLPALTKALAKQLKLVPESVPDEAKGAETIRLILRNLGSLTQYLAELRGLYGSGHGRNGKHRGLEPRHARLAVGAAVVFIDFATETYHQRDP